MSLPHAILGLLGYRPMTGYDLKKTFDLSVSHMWPASLSQIYRELNTLEDIKCVESVIEPQSDRPDRRIYSLTPKGKEEFRKWICDFPDVLQKSTRDEFTLRIFFGEAVGREETIHQLRRFAEQKRKNLKEVPELLKMVDLSAKQWETAGEEALYWKLVIRKAEMTLQMLITWAEEAITTLEKEAAT